MARDYKIVKFNRRRNVGGFTVKAGFLGVVYGGKLIAVTSGWCSGGSYEHPTEAFIYTKAYGGWVGGWVYPYSQASDIPSWLAEVSIARQTDFIAFWQAKLDGETA